MGTLYKKFTRLAEVLHEKDQGLWFRLRFTIFDN
jgi:hypothetical protein